jgi:hypothetical protein
MRCDQEGYIMCGFAGCRSRARYQAGTEGQITPLCPPHRLMLDLEGVPTEPLPAVRYTGRTSAAPVTPAP